MTVGSLPVTDFEHKLGLACAALSPGLRRILLFDTSQESFFGAASELAAMLEAAMGKTYRRIILGSAEGEDDLWTTLRLERDDGAVRILSKPGRLSPPPDDPRPILVLIPNLASLSLSASRACVTLMGEGETATLQRHGLDITWSPDMCWLARCTRAEVGEISLHLLDRFVLRLSAHNEPSLDRVAEILDWVNEKTPAGQQQVKIISPELAEELRSASGRTPAFPAAEVERVLAYFIQESAGMRRELSLARLSLALAQLEGAPDVSASHVNTAAKLIGLRLEDAQTSPLELAPAPLEPSEVSEKPKEGDTMKGGDVSVVPAPRIVSEDVLGDEVLKSDTELTFDTATSASVPYPEDITAPAREIDSLQFPPRRYRAYGAAEGPIIGTQPVWSLNDIAVVGTVVEAAKFQKVRPRREPDGPLLIARSDLRSYRRAPIPEQMLMILIDYTSLRGRLWQGAAWSHLRWAYVMRASVTVIQVGLAQPRGNDLRAELVSARNLLSPRIRQALNGRAGMATPLAHGLELASRTLRTALQHGRWRTQQARLVVISDARGNVPLASSRAGRLERPVFREGIDDAFEAARPLRTISNLDIYFLNPRPQQYPELPLMLAEVLGATVEDIPSEEPF